MSGPPRDSPDWIFPIVAESVRAQNASAAERFARRNGTSGEPPVLATPPPPRDRVRQGARLLRERVRALRDELGEATELLEALRGQLATRDAEAIGFRAEVASLRPLARFGLACFDAIRRDGGCDLDGGAAQDSAEECGLLERVEVAEPCDADGAGGRCRCAEYGEFPQECLRPTAAVAGGRGLIAGQTTEPKEPQDG